MAGRNEEISTRLEERLLEVERESIPTPLNLSSSNTKTEYAALTKERKPLLIVAGGDGTNTVESYRWDDTEWQSLHPLPRNRWGATSFTHKNHMTIAGGVCDGTVVDDMIRKNIDQIFNQTPWAECNFRLPYKLAHHSSVYNGNLIISGGDNRSDPPETATDHQIKELQLHLNIVNNLLGSPDIKRKNHGMELIGDNLFILGGTNDSEDNLKSVVTYNMQNNVWTESETLPYEVSDMATVRRGNNIYVIGGVDIDNEPLNTAFRYNVLTQEHEMLPSMRCKREGCAAELMEDHIVVMGGWGGESHRSVECFNIGEHLWKDLPNMHEARWGHTSFVV